MSQIVTKLNTSFESFHAHQPAYDGSTLNSLKLISDLNPKPLYRWVPFLPKGWGYKNSKFKYLRNSDKLNFFLAPFLGILNFESVSFHVFVKWVAIELWISYEKMWYTLATPTKSHLLSVFSRNSKKVSPDTGFNLEMGFIGLRIPRGGILSSLFYDREYGKTMTYSYLRLDFLSILYDFPKELPLSKMVSGKEN